MISYTNKEIKNHNTDLVFSDIVKNISPAVVSSDSQLLFDAFTDALGEVSPISINITDAFYKETSQKAYVDQVINNITGVQDAMKRIFLDNFWTATEDAKNNFVLRHKLEHIEQTYGNVGLNNGHINWFEDPDEMFNMERFILGREFKTKKGTETALEYAYKTVWDSKVEGQIRNDYSYKFFDSACDNKYGLGVPINDEAGSNMNTYPDVSNWPTLPPDHPYYPTNGVLDSTDFLTANIPGVPIGRYKILPVINLIPGDEPGDCIPFTYRVEGSLLDEFFGTMVRDLAHPVGFDGTYDRYNVSAWDDYFNLDFPISADSVNVYTLCFGGDCSKTNIDVYSDSVTVNKPTITDS